MKEPYNPNLKEEKQTSSFLISDKSTIQKKISKLNSCPNNIQNIFDTNHSSEKIKTQNLLGKKLKGDAELITWLTDQKEIEKQDNKNCIKKYKAKEKLINIAKDCEHYYSSSQKNKTKPIILKRGCISCLSEFFHSNEIVRFARYENFIYYLKYLFDIAKDIIEYSAFFESNKNEFEIIFKKYKKKECSFEFSCSKDICKLCLFKLINRKNFMEKMKSLFIESNAKYEKDKILVNEYIISSKYLNIIRISKKVIEPNEDINEYINKNRGNNNINKNNDIGNSNNNKNNEVNSLTAIKKDPKKKQKKPTNKKTKKNTKKSIININNICINFNNSNIQQIQQKQNDISKNNNKNHTEKVAIMDFDSVEIKNLFEKNYMRIKELCNRLTNVIINTKILILIYIHKNNKNYYHRRKVLHAIENSKNDIMSFISLIKGLILNDKNLLNNFKSIYKNIPIQYIYEIQNIIFENRNCYYLINQAGLNYTGIIEKIKREMI